MTQMERGNSSQGPELATRHMILSVMRSHYGTASARVVKTQDLSKLTF